jgi:hypothetical protein
MIPEMEWLGMRLNDVFEGAMADEPLLPLTLINRERIHTMLTRQRTDLDNVQQECRSKLQEMLVLNLKAEVQLLDDRLGGLVDWLEERVWKELVSAAQWRSPGKLALPIRAKACPSVLGDGSLVGLPGLVDPLSVEIES